MAGGLHVHGDVHVLGNLAIVDADPPVAMHEYRESVLLWRSLGSDGILLLIRAAAHVHDRAQPCLG